MRHILAPKDGRSQLGPESGFILPLVLIVSLIIGAGLMAMAARSWMGLSGSIRQSQSRQAREVAEAGLARLVESMNTTYAYLLIKDLANWNSTSFTSSICPSSNPNPAGLIQTDTINAGLGRYQLESYNFQGSPFYGGKAMVRMRGERLKSANGAVGATAIVEQTLDIKPKDCSGSYGEATSTSGFPGLLGQFIDMGNNDIKGKLSGNVLCLQCYSGSNYDSLSEAQKEALIKAGPQAEIDGQIFAGPIDLPPVPTPPDNLSYLYSNPPSITTNTTIVGGSTDPAKLLNGACVVSPGSPPITHCVVDAISLSGNKLLSVDTTNSPVRIYVKGAGASFTGQAAIKHTPASAPATELGLFGRPIDPTNQFTDQSVLLAGGASTTKLWAFFPDGNVGINGGSKESATCDASGECTGGDIYGAIWAKTWGGAKCEGCLNTGGSSSTVAQLVVPGDMGTQLFNSFGPQYALGIRDYVAVGVSRWSSFVRSTGG